MLKVILDIDSTADKTRIWAAGFHLLFPCMEYDWGIWWKAEPVYQ